MISATMIGTPDRQLRCREGHQSGAQSPPRKRLLTINSTQEDNDHEELRAPAANPRPARSESRPRFGLVCGERLATKMRTASVNTREAHGTDNPSTTQRSRRPSPRLLANEAGPDNGCRRRLREVKW